MSNDQNNTQLVQANSVPSVTEEFTNTSSVFFSSIVDDGSRETQVKIYNAMNDALSLSDYLNQPIEITDFLAHHVELLDEATGEISPATRIILVGSDGQAYSCVSDGIKSSITRIVGIMGQAPWNPAIKVIPVERKTRKGFKVMSLNLSV